MQMIKRLLFVIFVSIFLYVSLFIFMVIFNITLFVINVDHFPGGTIVLDKDSRYISKMDGFIVSIKKIDQDSAVLLKCKDSIDKYGYITPKLDQLIYIEIDGCDIKKFEVYSFLSPLIVIF